MGLTTNGPRTEGRRCGGVLAIWPWQRLFVGIRVADIRELAEPTGLVDEMVEHQTAAIIPGIEGVGLHGDLGCGVPANGGDSLVGGAHWICRSEARKGEAEDAPDFLLKSVIVVARCGAARNRPQWQALARHSQPYPR